MLFAPLVAVLAPAPPAAPAAFAPVQAPASQPGLLSWRFVQVEGQHERFDALDDASDGLGANAAWDFGEGQFLFGGVDTLTGDVDQRRFVAGGGYHVAWTAETDAFLAGAYVREAREDAAGGEVDEEGWRAQGGLRRAFGEVWEAEVRAGWQDVIDDGFVGGASVRWWFDARFALGASYDRVVDDDVFTVSVRYGL